MFNTPEGYKNETGQAENQRGARKVKGVKNGTAWKE